MRPFLLLSLLALLLACSSDPTTCDAVAVPSATVKVVDEGGVAVPDARVTFVFNGGAEQSAPCASGTASCPSRDIYTDAGTLLVKATSADGTKKAEQTAQPIQNGCTVPTQQITLTLR